MKDKNSGNEMAGLSPGRVLAVLAGISAALFCALVVLSGSSGAAVKPSFGKSALGGETSLRPTSLQYGPDGRLYVAQQNGEIKAYTVERAGANNYDVTDTESIELVANMQNHDDDGSPNDNVKGRQVTGILVTGSAAEPVIYVGSSDPRIGGGPDSDNKNLDTNSGVISRLDYDGSKWSKVDLVRGLPRSEENHSINGLQLSPDGSKLYASVGGNTNQGAPSNNFVFLPEYALSAAILSIDLEDIGDKTYDLPTLAGGGPFGGNDGQNQAKLVSGGPVQIHAPGFRNAYDLVISESGKMYTVDNGGNAGWGDIPENEGPAGDCTNGINEPGVTSQDSLHFVNGAGYYGGHPNPTRGNTSNTFGGQSPVPAANAVECDYRENGAEKGSLTTFPASTNGIDEYTASNFEGAMTGDLLAAGYDNTIYRMKLNAAGDALSGGKEALFSSVGTIPLDVTAQGDDEPFPGTVWAADIGSGKIVAFEPADFAGGGGGSCDTSNPNGDADGDGYTNEDEAANSTDPCSAADLPPDADNDGISNFSDPDDDNDGTPDTKDKFALDPDDGKSTKLPVGYSFNAGSEPGTLLNLGFTGLMTNGKSDYQSLYDPNNIISGAAAPVLTVESVSAGDAYKFGNDQENGFQFGINVGPGTEPFTAHTKILAPFSGMQPKDFQAMGLTLGTGDQDNYVKLTTTANGGGGGIEFGKEVNSSFANRPKPSVPMPGPEAVDLFLSVDPAAKTVQPSYTVTKNGNESERKELGGPEPIPASWVDGTDALAVGLISTSTSSGEEFPATWDFLNVKPDNSPEPPANEPPSVEPIADQQGTEGEKFALQVQATDPDEGDTLAYAATGLPAGLDIDKSTGEISGTIGAGAAADSPYAAKVTVSDGEGASDTQSFAFEVGEASATPVEPKAPAALVSIKSPGPLADSSTYSNGSFQIKNTSEEGQIDRVALDLSTAVLPDMVFDPEGKAGDELGKCFKADFGSAATGLVTDGSGSGDGSCAAPFSEPRDGGYDVVTIEFDDFDPGETFTFSTDVDPTSIKKDPTPGGPGSVSGLELTGSTATVSFGGDVAHQAETYRIPASNNSSENTVKAGNIDKPGLEVAGVKLSPTTLSGGHSAATVSEAQQTVEVAGPEGSKVSLFVMEGELGVEGVPNGGFDIEDYEANSAIKVSEKTATIGLGGTVDIPVTLTDSQENAGLNYMVAAIETDGRTGPNSDVAILDFDESSAPPPNEAPSVEPIADQTGTEGKQFSLQVEATDPDEGDTLSYEATGLPAGLAINKSTGKISGTIEAGASANSPYTAKVTVSDGTDESEQDFKITVDKPEPDPGPDPEPNPSELEMKPTDRLGFGKVGVGAERTRTVTLTNTGSEGSEPVKVGGIELSGDGSYSATPTGSVTVEPGESHKLKVTFAPDRTGFKKGSLSVEHDGGNGKLDLNLVGRAVASPSGCTIMGTDGDDTLRGTASQDVICGLSGNDELYGFGGNDIIRGGDGNDRLVGGDGDERLIGNGGNDRLFGQNGGDFLLAGSGEDYVNGGSDNDTIRGNQGNDRLVGATGNDTVIGGKDDDTMFGGPGRDRLFGQGGNDRMSGISGRDYVNGGSDNDTIRGNQGNDRLVGATGNDTVIGGKDDDTMFGGPGRDRLFGQGGRDTHILRDGVRGNDSANGGLGRDRGVGDPRDRLTNIP